MELRLGFLEAQDETRDPKLMVKVLKLEFPTLADVSHDHRRHFNKHC